MLIRSQSLLGIHGRERARTNWLTTMHRAAVLKSTHLTARDKKAHEAVRLGVIVNKMTF